MKMITINEMMIVMKKKKIVIVRGEGEFCGKSKT